MVKYLFKDSNGDIHYGTLAQDGFEKCSEDDLKALLEDLGERKFWRCIVCNDIHVGVNPPKKCPTCMQVDVYVEISEKELRGMVGI